VSFIEISKQNYFHNLDILSSKLGDKSSLAVVLKDNAYGHGLKLMADLSAKYGITKVIVRSIDEAKEIEELFNYILILAPTTYKKNHTKFHYVINSLQQINELPKEANVHLKVDSGMHRSGIEPSDIEEAFALMAKNSLKLRGVLTHFRSADELSSEFFWQMQNWRNIKQKALKLTSKYNFKQPLFHSANSAALLRVENYEDDFARCGIATYGYHQFPKSFKIPELKPILSLWAEKITTKNLKSGQRIGYGGAYKASKDMVVSTYDIGYGDGFFRHTNRGKFLGKISMDSCIIEGDEEKVCILKNAKEIANSFDTISYDVLVKLSPTIKRIITR
jgi:alanine racemase